MALLICWTLCPVDRLLYLSPPQPRVGGDCNHDQVKQHCLTKEILCKNQSGAKLQRMSHLIFCGLLKDFLLLTLQSLNGKDAF